MVKPRSISPFSNKRGAYLGMARVPALAWGTFFPGEKDLYTLWTRKLIPVFTDRSRISRADLPDGDRAVALELLDAVASRSVAMGRIAACESGDLASRFRGAATAMGDAVLCELVIRLPSHPQ